MERVLVIILDLLLAIFAVWFAINLFINCF